jgi:hypothetical protein
VGPFFGVRVAFLHGADLAGPMLPGKQFSDRVCLALVLFLAASGSLPLLAQVSTDDVHIQPRIQPPAPREPEIDPALKTHTKPYKVDVDMVLVPVTITDPMNRLVTGLDRDNFNLFEGKDGRRSRLSPAKTLPFRSA